MDAYKFPLIDVVKYCKGHYARTGSIWYDMALCLWKNGQGYGPFHSYTEKSKYTPQEECFKERINITEIICDKIRKLQIANHRLQDVFRNISPQECWKVGYHVKGAWSIIRKPDTELPEYEYWEAVLRAHLSILSMTTAPELGYEDWKEFKGCNIPELRIPVKRKKRKSVTQQQQIS